LGASMSERTVGILPVHLYGHPANMDGIFLAAKKHGLWVVEDCAQAFGAQYRGQRVGSIGGAGAFSFYPSKNLTVMGDGGCITTNGSVLAGKLRMLRNHGEKSKYVHDFVGYNFRLNAIQAEIGRFELSNGDNLTEHQQPAIIQMYSDLPRLPKTEEVVTQILSLPIYGDLPMEDVDYVCDAILEFFGKFTTANPSVGEK